MHNNCHCPYSYSHIFLYCFTTPKGKTIALILTTFLIIRGCERSFPPKHRSTMSSASQSLYESGKVGVFGGSQSNLVLIVSSNWHPDTFPLITVAVTDITLLIHPSFYLLPLPAAVKGLCVQLGHPDGADSLCLCTPLMRARIVTIPCDLTADMKYGNDLIASDGKRTQKVINLSVCL